jgi:hypothetical protein
MSERAKYLLDADTFIRAKREHYAFDFCPGFWEALLQGYEQGRICSVKPIQDELLRGKDALADWVKNTVPDEFFESVEDGAVENTYAKIIEWVEGSTQYSRAAKLKFVNAADPWLIAVAAVKGYILVTYEVSSPDSKSLIKIPDVAKQFNVKCIPPYVMLRQLEIQLQLTRQNS